MTLTGRQLRQARFRAGLELGDLAIRPGKDWDRSAYAEATYGAPAWTEAEFCRVRSALETAGTEFSPENGGRTGGQLRKVGQESAS